MEIGNKSQKTALVKNKNGTVGGAHGAAAIRPNKAIGGGAETWFCLLAAYDLARAMNRADRIKIARLTRVA